MIPQILHHIGPEDETVWHPFWKRCQRSWLDSFPHYEYKFWNDSEDIDRLVYDYYPRYWNLYQSFPVHIMRIDFARLCILHRYGGLYSDLDYYCYKNFDEDLKDHDIYFVENLTEEFTSATVENSLMAAVANNQFFLNTIGYVQACYIQFRNRFNRIEKNDSSWMISENRFLVNNTTGSGMLSVARDFYGRAHYDIGHFNTAEFNNRPSAYTPFSKAKHVHTSLWGEDQVRSDTTREIVIVDGNAHTMTSVPEYAKQQLTDTDYVLDFDSYNFHTDYTNDKYLQRDNSNLEQVKTWIRESEKQTHKIMTYNDTKDYSSNSPR